MVEIFDELAVIGYPVEEEDRVVQILTSLPDSFNMIVTAFEASSEVPKLAVVIERLLNEERKIKEKKCTGAVQGFSGDALFVSQNSRPKRCFYCGEPGHIKRFCDEWLKSIESEKKENKNSIRSPAVANFSCLKKKSNMGDSESSDDDECIALVSDVLKNNRNKWVVDSAASRHMCNERKQFIGRLKRLSQVKEITVGDGSIVQANFEGTVKLRIKAINQVRKFKLRKVLFVPELKYNLLSVSQASESGKSVQFDKNGAQIKDITSQETVGTATKRDQLYYVNIVERMNKRPEVRSCNKDMEKAFLSIKENNFKEELLRRLDRIEEDKLMLSRRMNSVEEDINCNSQSYALIKEEMFQKRQVDLSDNQIRKFQEVDEEVYIQHKYHEDKNEDEDQVSIQEDMFEQQHKEKESNKVDKSNTEMIKSRNEVEKKDPNNNQEDNEYSEKFNQVTNSEIRTNEVEASESLDSFMECSVINKEELSSEVDKPSDVIKERRSTKKILKNKMSSLKTRCSNLFHRR